MVEGNPNTHKVANGNVGCGSTVETDIKEAEGCCVERATKDDYIHNQMSKQVTNRVT
jgi:hypothetical protein